MKHIVSGRIYAIAEEERIISIKQNRKIVNYYFQRALMSKFIKYLTIDRFVQFVIDPTPNVKRGIKSYTVKYIRKIMELRSRHHKVFYDVKRIKKGTKDLLNNLRYKMFLDLEMSMHPYHKDKSFIQEIIQVGYVLTDIDDQVIETYSEWIKPTKHPKITKRTKKFLSIDQNVINMGIDYKTFYNHFQQIITKYKPAIIVWGRNDFLALRDSYKINRVPSLQGYTRYINLLKLHKNYFHLKNDLGLLNAFSLYKENEEDNQTHDAYEDAEFTREIFYGFKDIVNHKNNIDLKNYQ